MQFDMNVINRAATTAYRRLAGRRISRMTFAFRVAILAAAVFILAAPLFTILAPSSKTFRDAYLVLFLGMLVVCMLGFVSAYVKRLHDIGLGGYWAFLALIGIPAAISYGGYAYQHYRYSQDHSADLSGLHDVLFVTALALPLILALWRGEIGENRFGTAPEAVEHLAASTFNIAAIAGVAVILIPTCIYAGLFQSGIWVGRDYMAPSMPMIDSTAEGVRFMKCWNVKGVGAGSEEGLQGGFYRDGYKGTTFDFIAKSDGQIDIVTTGPTVRMSYRAEGFKVTPYGLTFPKDALFHVSAENLDQFMIAAIYDQGRSGGTINYTTFAFDRDESSWPEFHLVMTTARSAPADATGQAGLARVLDARGSLMIGDCMTG
jgi:uncharacterized membrane protein YhaH (DUF805 family)